MCWVANNSKTRRFLMPVRNVCLDFIAAMNEKLEHGRLCGRDEYDEYWHGTNLYSGIFLDRLLEEFAELLRAVNDGTKQDIRSEAADVANFAMFIADIHGALKKETK
jgi:NTP pyrophosphatase (non-canonical NTP hydrolase)